MKKIGLFYAAKAERTSWVAEKIQKEFGEDKLLPELRTMELKGKKVAIFGLGDQIRYPENFADGIGLLAEVFEGDGATLVGFTSSEGYTFERSRALRGNQWCGLVIDLDNQSEQAKKKIKEWCEQVKKEFA